MSNKQTDEQGKPLTYWGGLNNDHIVDTNKMVNKPQVILGEHSIQILEISDEEITKLANEHILYNDSKRQWVIEGMKLYREKLNKMNVIDILK